MSNESPSLAAQAAATSPASSATARFYSSANPFATLGIQPTLDVHAVHEAIRRKQQELQAAIDALNTQDQVTRKYYEVTGEMTPEQKAARDKTLNSVHPLKPENVPEISETTDVYVHLFIIPKKLSYAHEDVLYITDDEARDLSRGILAQNELIAIVQARFMELSRRLYNCPREQLADDYGRLKPVQMPAALTNQNAINMVEPHEYWKWATSLYIVKLTINSSRTLLVPYKNVVKPLHGFSSNKYDEIFLLPQYVRIKEVVSMICGKNISGRKSHDDRWVSNTIVHWETRENITLPEEIVFNTPTSDDMEALRKKEHGRGFQLVRHLKGCLDSEKIAPTSAGFFLWSTPIPEGVVKLRECITQFSDYLNSWKLLAQLQAIANKNLPASKRSDLGADLNKYHGLDKIYAMIINSKNIEALIHSLEADGYRNRESLAAKAAASSLTRR